MQFLPLSLSIQKTHTNSISAWGNQFLGFYFHIPNSVFKMESVCEVNPMPNKDNCESQSLKNQGNIYGGRGFLHQSSKPESTITSKTIEFKSIESQDDSRRCSKIITRHGIKDGYKGVLLHPIPLLEIFLFFEIWHFLIKSSDFGDWAHQGGFLC